MELPAFKDLGWTLAPAAGATHDLNADARSDLVWRDTSGNVAAWLMSNATVASAAALGNIACSWTVAGQRDFNGDGKADILWRNTTTGDVAIWFMSGTSVSSAAAVGNIATNWSIVGTHVRHGAVCRRSTGREESVFWRRVKGTPNKIEAAGAEALCARDAEPLGTDIIHSVINPIDKLTGATHIYGGDFFAAERSEWDSLPLQEQPMNGEKAQRVFEEANARYQASTHLGAG